MQKVEPSYLDWLHEVTAGLYDYGVMLDASRGVEVQAIYDEGKSSREAIIALAPKCPVCHCLAPVQELKTFGDMCESCAESAPE